MAFRALLFSKSPETNAAMTTACESTGIRAEICSDIFTAIEKAKTRAFSCVIADWADQPEASFLLKRARESLPNRATVAVVVVDHEPTAAEMRDHKLDFLIYRPISAGEADAVLQKACEQMQPSGAEDPAESSRAGSAGMTAGSGEPGATEQPHPAESSSFAESPSTEAATDEGETAYSEEDAPRRRSHAPQLNVVCAVALVLVAAFFLWRSRATIDYLSHTPEGRVRVLRESVAALFYMNQTGALPVSSAGADAQQDAYFSRNAATPDAQAAGPVKIGVVATESTLTETRAPLPKAADFPLPAPVLVQQEVPPLRVERVAIPESMRNSPPIAPPVVVTVNPAQMMPVSAPQSQPLIQPSAQPVSEPIALTEDAARALLVHAVDPVYPPAGVAQKLHGAVVLQTVIGRDGNVEDVKIVRGYFVLGRAAIAAVKQWRFQPYTINGRAASTQTTLTINFSSPG
ncbi:MAG TPA: TonB family protein [Terriglobales bacterium]|jgi:TonB family protein|nr:TonB family protein [Terriglobales bacterium]